jgi:Ser/Thr protein kinase RdoA (MazF antagonist)
VERDAGPGRANVHALLRHFEDVGFGLAPRLLGTSDDGRREIVSFLDGEAGYPPLSEALRSDEALVGVARAIRAMHDATAGYVPVDDAWGGMEVAVPAAIDCVGHHDLAPWNMVFDGSRVVGIIDWDGARPSNRAWDLAYAAHQFVPFHPPRWLEPFGWPEEPDRAARLRSFADAYGHGIQPAELVDLAVIRLSAFAAHMEARIRAADPAFATHQTEDHPAGYRAAARYILDHRESLLA